MTSFTKILKKYDKITGWNFSPIYLKEVESSYFVTSTKVSLLLLYPDSLQVARNCDTKHAIKLSGKPSIWMGPQVHKLMNKVEEIYTKHFTEGVRKKAISHLRPVRKQGSYRTTFFTGTESESGWIARHGTCSDPLKPQCVSVKAWSCARLLADHIKVCGTELGLVWSTLSEPKNVLPGPVMSMRVLPVVGIDRCVIGSVTEVLVFANSSQLSSYYRRIISDNLGAWRPVH